jgi:hypothetical protein
MSRLASISLEIVDHSLQSQVFLGVLAQARIGEEKYRYGIG